MFLFQFRQDTAEDWLIKDRVLKLGEPGYEIDTGKFKIGDGKKRWTQLKYFVPDTPLTGDIPVTDEAIMAHIQSSLPHPVYDDLPSLTLLFENGLV